MQFFAHSSVSGDEMAFKDNLPWLKAEGETPSPKSAAQQMVHLVFSLILLTTGFGFIFLVVMSDTRRTFECDESICFVKERTGLFSKPLKLMKAKKPVTTEVRERLKGAPALLLIDAYGESEWITSTSESPARIQEIQRDLAAYKDGDVYEITSGGFGLEWWVLCVLLVASSFLNLRNSLRWFISQR